VEGTKPLTDIKVLLVEDEPVVAMGLADQLSAAGATVVGPCATARGAIDALQGNEVDVAVIDFVLADRNSESLQLALERKGIPFVVLTGYPAVLVRRQERQEILSKPVPAEILCSSVRTLARAATARSRHPTRSA
jgi:DNA-binding NarL/FixJ family response regulator